MPTVSTSSPEPPRLSKIQKPAYLAQADLNQTDPSFMHSLLILQRMDPVCLLSFQILSIPQSIIWPWLPFIEKTKISLIKVLATNLHTTWSFPIATEKELSLHPRDNLFVWESHPFLTLRKLELTLLLCPHTYHLLTPSVSTPLPPAMTFSHKDVSLSGKKQKNFH